MVSIRPVAKLFRRGAYHASLLTTCCLITAAAPLPLVAPLAGQPLTGEAGSGAVFIPDAELISPEDARTAMTRNAARMADGKLESLSGLRVGFGGDARSSAVDCLAAAGYYEAGDDLPGQQAVMQVVVNRVRHPAYPNSVCAVVFEGSQRQTGCQFTFTCDGALRRQVPRSAWLRAQGLAERVLDGLVDEEVGTATHYHANYVLPYWSYGLDKLMTRGAHIFYRMRGRPGSAAAFGHSVSEDRASYAEFVARAGARGASITSPANSAVADVDMIETLPVLAASVEAAPPRLPRGTFIRPVMPSAGSGRWAVEALDTCRGLSECVVIGYANDMQLQQALGSAEQQRPRPTFAFIRDASSGQQLAFWDCQQVQRPNADQCLPSDEASVRRLIRNRGS